MNHNEILIKHIIDLAQRTYDRNYNTFSQFLNIDEIGILKTVKLKTDYALWGGYENAERCIACFGEKVNEYDFPIVCIKIEPLQQKFADTLNHRDFLGSLMNLGINRNTLGDIVIKNNTGYLFCLESINTYIIQNLTRIRHTSVSCKLIEEVPAFITELPEETEIITSSLRVDAVICAVYKLSRNLGAQLFHQEKIFINSKAVTKESTLLKNGDNVTVRGFGKFIFENELRKTKKDRTVISVRIY